MIDLKQLANRLVDIAEKAAPLVGLDDELEAGVALYASISGAVREVRGALDGDDQAALQGALDKLASKVNHHANSTIGKLEG